MRYLYFDCIGGASGDMILGAFLDGLVPREHLETELRKLSLSEYRLELERTSRHHISAHKLTVQVQETHHHRHLSDIVKLIEESDLAEAVKHHSLAIFRKLGEQEAKVHNIPVEKVHFHEVGAVDSIVDIVGACICVEYLKPEEIFTSPLPISRGTVSAAHGTLPVPAPATLGLMQGYPLVYRDVEGELVTPTGAALITHFSRGPLPENAPLTIDRIGYGAGSRDFAQIPNLLRIWQGEISGDFVRQTVLHIETNIDDMNPEWYPAVMEKLFQAGALDVSIYPNLMKKGRPGMLLTVLCDPALLPAVREILFRETTTLGFRYTYMHREHLPRTLRTVDSPWGKLSFKEVIRQDQVRRLPEFEECRRIARMQGKPLKDVYEEVIAFLSSLPPAASESVK